MDITDFNASDLENVKYWASLGLSEKRIRTFLGIDTPSWAKLKKYDPRIDTALRKGIDQGAFIAMEALQDNIKKKNQRAIEYFLERQCEEWKQEAKPETVNLQMLLSPQILAELPSEMLVNLQEILEAAYKKA